MLSEVIYNLKKSIFLNVIIVLQFCCFLYLFSIIFTYYYNINTATWLQNIKGDYRYYTLYESEDNDDISDDPMMVSNIKSALNEVYQLSDCTYMAINRNAGACLSVDMLEEHFKGESYEKLLEDSFVQENSDGVDVVTAYLCRMDKNAIQHYISKAAMGRIFAEEDFNLDIHETEVPVMLGAEYSNYFQVGDTFYLRMTKPLTAKVIGFLPKNTTYIADNTMEEKGYAIQTLDCTIILPYFDITGTPVNSEDKIFLDENYYNYLQGTLLMKASVSEMKAVQIQEELNEIFVKNNLYTVAAQNASQGMRMFQKETRESVTVLLVLVIVMAVFNIFSLCMSLLNKLNFNMNRYAIQLMNGQWPAKILWSYLLEILIMFMAALAVTGCKMWHEITSNISFLWLLLGTAVLVMLPCIIVLCRKMYSIDMEALLRRKEAGE